MPKKKRPTLKNGIMEPNFKLTIEIDRPDGRFSIIAEGRMGQSTMGLRTFVHAYTRKGREVQATPFIKSMHAHEIMAMIQSGIYAIEDYGRPVEH